jgi:hypothetical protein
MAIFGANSKLTSMTLDEATPGTDVNSKADSLERLSQDMAVLYENNMAKSDENINIDISSFFSILDLSRFCAPDGSVDVSHSVFGPTLAPCPAPETPRSANLQRLPRITEMESSDSTAVEQSGIASHVSGYDKHMQSIR